LTACQRTQQYSRSCCHAFADVNPTALQFRKAIESDAQSIANLVNSGYRGDASRAGWTTEADYLVGARTDAHEVRALIVGHDTAVLLCLMGGELVGSVHLQHTDDAAYLGMFVVKPALQGQGIGKHFMQASEAFVQQEWKVRRIQMTVITLRHELIAYYERRGYKRTGILKPFPVEDKRSTALVDELKFEVLEKQL
jgi:ribosomal protein S18 acetylase RimI-like enzyme